MSTPTAQDIIIEAIAARVVGSNRGLGMLPYFICGYIDSMMMGLVVAQAFTYWRFVRSDKRHIVAAVFLVVVLSAIASTIILLWLLDLFVWSFGTYSTFLSTKWVVRHASVEIATIIVTQAFYVDRACRLWRHWWPAALMGPCVLAAAVLGCTSIHLMSTYSIFGGEMTKDGRIDVLAYSWLSFVLGTDLLITGVIAYGLFRIKTGWASTETKLRRALIRCFETQTPALLSSAVCLIMWSQSFEIVLGLIMMRSKIFALGLLITLNLRASSFPTDTNVSTFSNVKSTSTYPMDHLSSDRSHIHSVLPANNHNTDWRLSPHAEVDKKPRDLELDHESLHDVQYGSTTGLNMPNHGK